MVDHSYEFGEGAVTSGAINHVVIDAKGELHVGGITKPANVQDSVMFIPIFNLMLQ